MGNLSEELESGTVINCKTY